MRSTASSLEHSLIGDVEAEGDRSAPEVLARRHDQRRQMLGLVGISYVIDAAVLLVYAAAGTTTPDIAAAYGLCGLLALAVFAAMSEAGLNERFSDPHLVLPQSIVNLAIALSFMYVAPEVSIVFVCSIFLTFTYSSLRSTSRQTVIGWTITLAGLSCLFLLTDKPISLPHGTQTERLISAVEISLVLGRVMALGLFSASLRMSLYKRGVELKEAYKRIEELAELDELTGAFNRRSIMRTLEDEIVRARRSKQPCSVALIDLDWFKRINDKFGHPTGDEVLRTFAITIFANIRGIDKIGRYGGEEFLLILPETADRAAERMLDRLRAIVADLDWSAISQGMLVTISAGVTTLQPEDMPDSILARADKALYQAKDFGRNKVVQI